MPVVRKRLFTRFTGSGKSVPITASVPRANVSVRCVSAASGKSKPMSLKIGRATFGDDNVW